MPLTLNVFRWPSANVTASGEPVTSLCDFAYPLSTNAPSFPSVAIVACEPVIQSRWNIVLLGGLTRGREEPLAERADLTGAHVADRLDDRALRGSIGRRRRDRAEVVLCRDRVVRVVPDVVDGAAEARRDAGGEHRDQRDERQPDHQRGGGRRRALRVAARVVARERTRSAAQARRRPAERPGERADEALREHRDADEDQERADAHRDAARRSCRGPA